MRYQVCMLHCCVVRYLKSLSFPFCVLKDQTVWKICWLIQLTWSIACGRLQFYGPCLGGSSMALSFITTISQHPSVSHARWKCKAWPCLHELQQDQSNHWSRRGTGRKHQAELELVPLSKKCSSSLNQKHMKHSHSQTNREDVSCKQSAWQSLNKCPSYFIFLFLLCQHLMIQNVWDVLLPSLHYACIAANWTCTVCIPCQVRGACILMIWHWAFLRLPYVLTEMLCLLLLSKEMRREATAHGFDFSRLLFCVLALPNGFMGPAWKVRV